jgi:cupin superfamily acireductone dioxygenase involved in methionine salvage
MDQLKKYIMSTIKDLTAEELTSLKELSERYNKIVIGLGEINLIINDLEKRVDELKAEKSNLLADHVSLLEKQKVVQNELVEKYGEGTIDLSTGKIETLK